MTVIGFALLTASGVAVMASDWRRLDPGTRNWFKLSAVGAGWLSGFVFGVGLL